MTISYWHKRRTFLAGIGAAYGLRSVLRTMEASAAGSLPPPRLLVSFWPAGTVHYNFIPSGTGTSYVPSHILQPFEDLGLREDTLIVYGLHHQGLTAPGGGGSEYGVVAMMTGASSPGSRENGGEADDSVAGGPSWDQILLHNAASLQVDGPGYVNGIGDARVDSNETSAQNLSYSYTTRSVEAAQGGTIEEHIPLLAEKSPLALFSSVFSGMMPGGDSRSRTHGLPWKGSE